MDVTASSRPVHLDSEMQVIKLMVHDYCRIRHGRSRREPLCPECSSLLDYAVKRLESCPRFTQRTTCRRCTVHCYSPSRRQQIRDLMRFMGPRMLYLHPVIAIRHLIADR